MDERDEMVYEEFIKQCWNCERGDYGADADIIEGVWGAEIDRDNATTDSDKQKYDEIHTTKLNEVKKYAGDALNRLIERLKDDEQWHAMLDEILDHKVQVGKVSDGYQLVEALKEADKIFYKYKFKK
jgi:hypothetical protein